MPYIHRNVGDVIQNNAVLIERINGQKWKMRCTCGNTFIGQVSGNSGICRDCAYKSLSIKRTVHGESKKEKTRLYNIWLGMRNRCNNPKNHRFDNYGGRGINVASEWNDYSKFREWSLNNGYKDYLSLDRKDNSKGYSPDNCHWVTQTEQMNNIRNNHLLTYKGETKTMAEWSRLTGIKYHTLKRRINRYKWSVERALEERVKTNE